MTGVFAIVKKEFKQIARDRKMIPLVLASPVFQLVLLGYAATMDIKEVRLAVCDHDKSSMSRELVRSVVASDIFRAVAFVDNEDQIDPLIASSKVHMGLVLPKDFEKAIVSMRGTSVLVVADGSEAAKATIALNYMQEALLIFASEQARKALAMVGARDIPLIRVEPRVFYNEELKSRDFMVPAVLAMVLMVMTVVLSSMNIVREKEYGTIEQLVVTPLKGGALIAGKLLPFLVIGLVDICIVVLVAVFWFAVPMRGSYVSLLLASLLFLVSTLGLGLFVSTVAKTQQQAMMIAVFFVMVPSVLLSGFIFPIENMPTIFQEASRFVPMRHYLAIVRDLFLKGTGLRSHLSEVVQLAGLGVFIFGLAATMFRKRVD
jgi:ABC-2 type transport system permease protein